MGSQTLKNVKIELINSQTTIVVAKPFCVA